VTLPPPCTRRVINGDAVYLSPAFASSEQVHGDWERAAYARFKCVLRPGMTVFDVGASFGLYAIAAARAVAPSGRVYAFEPAQRTASALRVHLAANGVADAVEVVEAAVADRTGSALFWEQEMSFMASLVEGMAREEERRYGSPVQARRVRAVELDAFCRDRRLEPDVIKVDVEGGEAAVLRGARALLRRNRGLLFLEVHSGFPAGGADAAVFGELRRARWSWEHLASEGATRHYVCSPTEPG
jgi:FkbM family methyltransferase